VHKGQNVWGKIDWQERSGNILQLDKVLDALTLIFLTIEMEFKKQRKI
jgi:hypothetical protein